MILTLKRENRLRISNKLNFKEKTLKRMVLVCDAFRFVCKLRTDKDKDECICGHAYDLDTFRLRSFYMVSLSIVIGIQADAGDGSGSRTSISSVDGRFISPSFVFKSTDASDANSLDDPMSELASTPLSPDVDPTSIMLSWRSFEHDAAFVDDDGDGESFSKEMVDKGDDVIELKAFVMNIFGVERPVSLLLFVEESGLGQIGKGDIIGDDPLLKLMNLIVKLCCGAC